MMLSRFPLLPFTLWAGVFGAAAAVHAQAPSPTPPRPAFEVASIRPSEAEPHSSSGIHTRNGRLDAHNVTLKRCIMGAYGLGPRQIIGGPDWIDSESFQITAKAEDPADGDDALMAMLQTLMAERFKLALHHETRNMRAFVLEIANGGMKLEKADAGESLTNTSHSNTRGSIDARHTDMDLFAKVLARQLELPVVNHTGLQGAFNFKLQWAPENLKPADAAKADWPSIFTAIQEQLGLRLRAEKATVDVLAIDHVERPSEN